MSIVIEQILFAGREIKTEGGAAATKEGTALEPNDVAPPNSEIVVIVHNKSKEPINTSVSFHGTAPELKMPWCLVGTKHPGAAEKDPWGVVPPGDRVELRHKTQRALALTKVFLMELPVQAPQEVEAPQEIEARPRHWTLCLEHRRTLDGYARGFPPAVETAEKAEGFLYVMADDETRQVPGARCPACAIGEDRQEDADYACLRAVRCALEPEQVPLDVVLTVVPSGTVLEPGQAIFLPQQDGRVEIVLRLCDHRQNPIVPLKLEAHTSGPARMGKHLRFTLSPVFIAADGASVWKLAPSLNIPRVVRAFLTFVVRSQPLLTLDEPRAAHAGTAVP